MSTWSILCPLQVVLVIFSLWWIVQPGGPWHFLLPELPSLIAPMLSAVGGYFILVSLRSLVTKGVSLPRLPGVSYLVLLALNYTVWLPIILRWMMLWKVPLYVEVITSCFTCFSTFTFLSGVVISPLFCLLFFLTFSIIALPLFLSLLTATCVLMLVCRRSGQEDAHKGLLDCQYKDPFNVIWSDGKMVTLLLIMFVSISLPAYVPGDDVHWSQSGYLIVHPSYFSWEGWSGCSQFFKHLSVCKIFYCSQSCD